MTAGENPVPGPHLPPGARITPDGLVYCTVPAHQDGEHDHNEDGPLRAVRRHRAMASSPGQDAERKAADRDRGREAKDALSTRIAQWQKDREAQDAKGGNGGSS